jgi:quinol monooxygenase YgiN
MRLSRKSASRNASAIGELTIFQLQDEYRARKNQGDEIGKDDGQGAEQESIDEPQADAATKQDIHAQTDVFCLTAADRFDHLRQECGRGEYRRGVSNPITHGVVLYGAMPFVSITRLRLRSAWFLPRFIWDSLFSLRQVRRATGNLSADVLNDARRTFWTRSLWQDEAAMKAFLRAEPHLRAMKKLPNWCDEAALVHWTQEGETAPDWTEAHRRMLAEGRRSKVNFPSPAHETFEIPPPRI